MLEPLLRPQDTEQLDLVYWKMSRDQFNVPKGTSVLGIPQSVIMCNAAVAVPPVAIRGSGRKIMSTGGDGGSFE